MSLNSLTMARVSGSFLLLSSLRWSWNEVLDRHISTWSRHCLRSAAMETRLEGLERWCVSCYQHAGGVSGAGLVRRVSLCGDKTCLSSLSGSGGDWMIPLCWYTHTHTSRSVCVSDKVSHTVHYLYWSVWAVYSTTLSVQSIHGGSAFARLISLCCIVWIKAYCNELKLDCFITNRKLLLEYKC